MSPNLQPKVLRQQYVPSSEFYSQVIESLQDYSILTIDNELNINSWSSGATKIFQYTPEEIMGKSFNIIFTEEDNSNRIPEKEIKTANDEGRAVDNRWHQCKDGSKFYAYGLVFPIIGVEGEKLGFAKILRDLTEEKKSEMAINKYIKDLEDLNEHKENILAILSHDLRSPLARIISIAGYLKSDVDKIEQVEMKQMLDFLYDASTEELKMLDYLVEWARIKYASQSFEPANIDISQYVSKVFETLKHIAYSCGVLLQNDTIENTIAYADGKMVLSILQNIITNAIKYSKEGDSIIVTASRKGNMIEVQVKDQGTGMSPIELERLFTPQMKMLAVSTKENKGAGIGMLLAKSFLDKNNGKIWAESIEGKGSTFFFTLPIKPPAEVVQEVGEIEAKAIG